MTEGVDVRSSAGGNAGYACAWRRPARLSVILVDATKWRTCLHRGASRRSPPALGPSDRPIRSAGDIGVLWRAVREWARSSGTRALSSPSSTGPAGLIKARKVTSSLVGRARRPDAIEVTTPMAASRRSRRGPSPASGSYARSLPFIQIDGEAFITSDHALNAGEPSGLGHHHRGRGGRTRIRQPYVPSASSHHPRSAPSWRRSEDEGVAGSPPVPQAGSSP